MNNAGPHNPFSPPAQPPMPPPGYGYHPPRPKSSNRLVLGCFLGGGAVFVVGLIALTVIGMGMVDEEVEAELKVNPVVVNHLGAVERCEQAWLRSMNDDRFEYFHYDCYGDKGDGKLEIHSEPDGPGASEVIIDGTLMLPDGTRHDIMAEVK